VGLYFCSIAIAHSLNHVPAIGFIFSLRFKDTAAVRATLPLQALFERLVNQSPLLKLIPTGK